MAARGPNPRGHAKTRPGPGPPPGRHRVLLHPGQPGRAARRLRHLAADHPRAAGPDLIVTIDTLDTDPCQHQYQARGHDPRHQAPAPIPDPALCLHQPRLPAAPPGPATSSTTPRTRRADGTLLVQTAARNAATTHRLKQQPGWDRRPAARRDVPLDHPGRAQLRHRTPPATPHLAVPELGHEIGVSLGIALDRSGSCRRRGDPVRSVAMIPAPAAV